MMFLLDSATVAGAEPSGAEKDLCMETMTMTTMTTMRRRKDTIAIHRYVAQMARLLDQKGSVVSDDSSLS